jgi:hypothetical protein
MGTPKGIEPKPDDILAALASDNPRTRWIARRYVAANIWTIPIDNWISSISSRDEALWTAVAALSLLVRTEGTTLTSAIERMEREATEDFLLHADQQLAILTAFELARVGKNFKPLEIISNRQLSADGLLGIKSDLYRILRGSKELREHILGILEHNQHWAGFSADELRKLDDEKIFTAVK